MPGLRALFPLPTLPAFLAWACAPCAGRPFCIGCRSFSELYAANQLHDCKRAILLEYSQEREKGTASALNADSELQCLCKGDSKSRITCNST